MIEIRTPLKERIKRAVRACLDVIPVAKARATQDYLAELRSLYEKGMSTIELGSVYGVGHTTILDHLRRAGATIRSSQEGAALAFAKRREAKKKKEESC